MEIAFKEWAVVCRALADGQQSLIIRKGGISETGGVFQPEHARFWLYSTHFHEQQQKGVKAEAQSLLESVEANRPPLGTLRVSHWVDVSEVLFVDQLERALALNDLHIWTPETITQRFHYRHPGLYVLAVRVWQSPLAEIPEHHDYAGCKTWVELKESLPTQGSNAVLAEAEYDTKLADLRRRLHR